MPEFYSGQLVEEVIETFLLAVLAEVTSVDEEVSLEVVLADQVELCQASMGVRQSQDSSYASHLYFTLFNSINSAKKHILFTFYVCSDLNSLLQLPCGRYHPYKQDNFLWDIFWMQQSESMVIREQQKENNPIFRVVFNKMRNLRKKVAQIEQIKALDHRTLKQPQLDKLAKEDEVLAQIERLEDFARMYKAILIENNLVYDKVDDLLKISTLLTVGKRVHLQGYCPLEVKNVYEKIYSKIFGNAAGWSKDLSDEVIRVYQILWTYLDKDANYSQCRDYLSYIDEIDARMTKNKPNQKGAKKQMNLDGLQPILADINKKINKLQHQSEILKISLEYSANPLPRIQEEALQKLQKIISSQKDVDSKQDNSTTNPEGDPQIVQQLQTQIATANAHPESSLWVQKTQVQMETNHVDFHSADNKTASNNPKNSRGGKNRERRNRKPKKIEYPEYEFNVRKCSDTSLEPTPEKYRAKRKYMEKKEHY